MATAEIELGTVSEARLQSGALPVLDSVLKDHDIITLSGSSQQSDFSVPTDGLRYVWRLTAVGAAMRVLFGSNPTATAAEAGGFYISSGATEYFNATPGDKVAVITQS